MGLFDKFVKGIKSGLKDAFAQEEESTASYTEPVVPSAPAEPYNSTAYVRDPIARGWGSRYDAYQSSNTIFSFYITESQFPGYTIEKDVHPNVFDAAAHPKCFHITYLFKKDGEPVLAILLMFRNQYRAMTAKGTYEVLDNSGIKYLRFYREMDNEKSYVIDRIKANLP